MPQDGRIRWTRAAAGSSTSASSTVPTSRASPSSCASSKSRKAPTFQGSASRTRRATRSRTCSAPTGACSSPARPAPARRHALRGASGSTARTSRSSRSRIRSSTSSPASTRSRSKSRSACPSPRRCAHRPSDPDVMMVGEIRDPETAKIAIEAIRGVLSCLVSVASVHGGW